ncbi:MAG: S24 family peptidase [Bryobacteraceae bacterium]|nr:S24 family peptidase [Bryobacteraceae bacterium]
MPSTKSPTQLAFAEALRLDLALPGERPVPIAVALHEPETGELHFRFRQDWDSFVPEEDLDFVTALEADFAAKVREMGGTAWLEWLEEHCSHMLRISDRERVLMGRPEQTLGRLYREQVTSEVREYRTHLPLYGLRAAAGHFSGQQTVEPEGWIEVRGHRLKPGQFVATVVGESMLPLIPDGSLCVFEANVTGSRQGRLVLVENRSAGAGERYTVKRYRSEKAQSSEGDWRHERILLEPLNPEFAAWELTADDDLAVVAEFQYVLE